MGVASLQELHLTSPARKISMLSSVIPVTRPHPLGTPPLAASMSAVHVTVSSSARVAAKELLAQGPIARESSTLPPPHLPPPRCPTCRACVGSRVLTVTTPSSSTP